MKHFASTLCLAVAVSLAGCASQVVSSSQIKSYTVGQPLRTTVGGTLLRIEKGQVNQVRRWVGILNSPDGWQTETVRSSDYVSSELIYSGATGTTVELTYREFRGGLAAPAFFQNLKYDIASSDRVTFKNFVIRIYSADNSGISAVLLSDGQP